jgi:putative zinc finger/helix-turn-helix YgiT family protein
VRTEKCSNCGADAKVIRGRYNFDESGLKVTLQGIEIIRCKNCGNEDPIIPRLNKLMRVIALAVIRKPYRLKGEDVRFLRKHLEMTGEEFSRLMHVDKTTLSKWENNQDPIGDQSDRLIRVIALSLGDGLKEELKELITRRFGEIGDEDRSVDIQMNAETLAYQYVCLAKTSSVREVVDAQTG